MCCRGDLGQPSSAAGVRRGYGLAIGAWVAVLGLGLPGCVYFPGSAAGTVEIEVSRNESASGDLFDGQRLRAIALVEAGNLYDVSASLIVSGGATDPGEIIGVVSGAPLAGPVEFSVGTSPESEPSRTIIADADGEVTIEFVFPSVDQIGSGSELIDLLRRIIRGPVHATYQLLLTDRGPGGNGMSPLEPVALAVGPDGEQTGILASSDEAHYFALDVQAETAYQLTLESTDSVNLTSGCEDRFGQVNFGVPTAGGLSVTVTAAAGVPGSTQFTAPATETVLLRLTAARSDPASEITIQYAIFVVKAVLDETPEAG